MIEDRLQDLMDLMDLQDLMLLAVEAERTKCVSLQKSVDYFWNSFEVERR